MKIDSYPKIKDFVLSVAAANGMINREEPELLILEKTDMAITADGVYTSDIDALETWLGTLSKQELETLSDGDADAIDVLLAFGPWCSTDGGFPVIRILDDVFGF